MVPVLVFPPITPFTDQYTPELLLVTVAVNCAVVLMGTDAVAGVRITTVELAGVLVLDFLPPQAISTINEKISNSNRDFIRMRPL
jgi:hypothetical protein